jgi:hypothetical protein
MITKQPSWLGSFGLVVTLMSYDASGPGTVPAVGMCGVTLSFLLHWGLTHPTHCPMWVSWSGKDLGRFTYAVVGVI